MSDSFLSVAVRGDVVRRALRFALIVGPILIAINHWDTIMDARLTSGVLTKMALTFLVPYLVSTLSSVCAVGQKDNG